MLLKYVIQLKSDFFLCMCVNGGHFSLVMLWRYFVNFPRRVSQIVNSEIHVFTVEKENNFYSEHLEITNLNDL